MSSAIDDLAKATGEALSAADGILATHRPMLRSREVGIVTYVAKGTALVRGLPGVQSEELVELPHGLLGFALNLDPGEVGVVLLGSGEALTAGAEVRRAHRLLSVPVGEALLGRVVDAVGRPLDRAGRLRGVEHRPVEREAPAILDRAPVEVPLQTGIKVVDTLVAIGRGQRELILGDRQTGKTAIAVDTILNQRAGDVACVYCAIGQRTSSVARVVAELRERGASEYTTVVVASGEDPPGLQFVAPYAATAIAEWFVDQGRDALVVYDDLTRHARAYRELSLLLRRPPGREAYPGDIFYIHSRLLERSAHLRAERGGGSLTALPIIETEGQNISAYIPTNVISITDGQIYLSPNLMQKGILPPVDVGQSVSRVGGKAQLAAYRAVAGELRLSYSQFQELETFARFSTRLDDDTRRKLERGRRVREALKQPQYSPLSPPEQIAVLLSVTEGLLDDLPTEAVERAEEAIRRLVAEELGEVCERIAGGEELVEGDRRRILDVARRATESLSESGQDGDAEHPQA